MQMSRVRMKMSNRTVSASCFVGTIAANVDNRKISDKEFRELVRNTLPIVQYDPGRFPLYEGRKKQKAKSVVSQTYDMLGQRAGGFA